MLILVSSMASTNGNEVLFSAWVRLFRSLLPDTVEVLESKLGLVTSWRWMIYKREGGSSIRNNHEFLFGTASVSCSRFPACGCWVTVGVGRLSVSATVPHYDQVRKLFFLLNKRAFVVDWFPLHSFFEKLERSSGSRSSWFCRSNVVRNRLCCFLILSLIATASCWIFVEFLQVSQPRL